MNTVRTLVATGVLGLSLGLASSAWAGEAEDLDKGEILISSEAVPGSEAPRITVRAVVDSSPEVVWGFISHCDLYAGGCPASSRARS